MSTELVPFSNGDYNIRILEIDGEPWFVARDVCEALELTNVTEALRGLDDDEFRSTEVVGLDGRKQPNTQVISEAGLYSLILRSRKPEAKKFKRWVTHDVLPTIRKYGVYSVNAPAPVAVRQDKSDALKLLQYKTRSERKEARELEAKGLYRNPLTGEIVQLPGVNVIERVRYEYTGDTWAVNNPLPPAERRQHPDSTYRNTIDQDGENGYA